MRPSHWIKNCFVLLPLLLSPSPVPLSNVIISVALACLFSLLSSSVYLLNDIIDINHDRNHPSKAHRPIAKGIISIGQAKFFLSIFTIAAIALAYVISFKIALLFMAYWILNFFYSLGLKKIILLDVCCIAIGFVLRFMVGAVALKYPPPVGILGSIFFLSLFLGFCKRKNELPHAHHSRNFFRQKAIGSYTPALLRILIIVSAIFSCVSYTYFAFLNISPRGNFNLMKISILLVYLGIGRYFYLLKDEGYGDCPTKTLYYDKILLLVIFIWAITVQY